MAPTQHYIEDDRRLAFAVRCADLNSERALAHTFDQLEAVLDAIRPRLLGDDKIYYFSTEIVVTRLPLSLVPGAGRSSEAQGFDPWKASNPRFWAEAALHPALTLRIEAWADRLAALVDYANTLPLSTEGLWEFDTCLLGEPGLTTLAIADERFVPLYTRMMSLWDLGHAVEQFDVIRALVERYGLTADLEAFRSLVDED